MAASAYAVRKCTAGVIYPTTFIIYHINLLNIRHNFHMPGARWADRSGTPLWGECNIDDANTRGQHLEPGTPSIWPRYASTPSGLLKNVS
jgi:hypothetical protein